MASYKFRLLAFKPSRETFNTYKHPPRAHQRRHYPRAAYIVGDGRETLNWSAMA